MKPITIGAPYGVYSTLDQRGVSAEADLLRDKWCEVFSSLAASVAHSATERGLATAFREIEAETSHENWDGYGAEPLNKRSLEFAFRLGRYLPAGFPAPDISVDPDGDVTFGWQPANHRLFSVSIGPNGTMHYAGVFGTNEVHGAEGWREDLPKPLFENLQRTFA